MAQKRMFDRSIIETDNFLNISLSAKAIYFLLGMEADDEGFVSPSRVTRLYGGEPGDIKNLIDVGLIIPFKSGVVVITNWNDNNYLDRNRIKPTKYQEEKKMLSLTPERKYVLNTGLTSVKPEERSGVESRVLTSAPASQEARELMDDSSVEPDEENTPTRSLSRQGAIKAKGYDPKLTVSLLRWAEALRGSRFGNPLKQKKAISIMLSTGRTVEDIQKKWSDMKTDPYWSVQGFDFATLSSQFDKTKGTPHKERHVAEMLELK